MARVKKILSGRRRHSRRFGAPEVSLTPLIDTSLTLLVIFMITAPVMNGIKVDLAEADSKEVGMQQELVITLNKDGNLFFNSFPVRMSTLVDSVKGAMNGRDDLPVYIRGDKDVSYGTVIKIVDTLKLAGIKYVAMSTRPVSSSSAQNA
jgi:biopolymer transport protein TolR